MREKMGSNKGFTLIEILIALSIFAVLASLTSSVLYYAFNTNTRLNTHLDRINSIQLAVSLMQQDLSQTLNRAVRRQDMQLSPAWAGQPQYLEFTRDGMPNPKGLEKRSTLKRIAYACKEGKLLRRTWRTLDSVNSAAYEEKILLPSLTSCHFSYFNQNLQLLSEWPEQHQEPFPKAVQIDITIPALGAMSLLFLIPGALYA